MTPCPRCHLNIAHALIEDCLLALVPRYEAGQRMLDKCNARITELEGRVERQQLQNKACEQRRRGLEVRLEKAAKKTKKAIDDLRWSRKDAAMLRTDLTAAKRRNASLGAKLVRLAREVDPK